MKQFWKLSLLLVIIVGAALWFMPRSTFRNVLVDTASQHYTHERMLRDLHALGHAYPEYLKWEIADTTAGGRLIPMVTFGNPEAEHHVMVQAAMHAREYMSSQMVMALLEYYAWLCKTNGTVDGINVRDLFNGVCFTVLPMVNPDGVSISQFGLDAATDRPTRRWLAAMVDSGYDCTQIKANARGVDLNRNFCNGFGLASNARTAPDFDFYPGPEPLSEEEALLMLRVANQHDYDCFLNYHTSGNLIYYGCGNATDEVNDAARRMSDIISEVTGYEGYGPDSAAPNGSWADEVETRYGRPSATIELGTRNPVPIGEFPDLFRRNAPVWAHLAARL